MNYSSGIKADVASSFFFFFFLGFILKECGGPGDVVSGKLSGWSQWSGSWKEKEKEMIELNAYKKKGREPFGKWRCKASSSVPLYILICTK